MRLKTEIKKKTCEVHTLNDKMFWLNLLSVTNYIVKLLSRVPPFIFYLKMVNLPDVNNILGFAALLIKKNGALEHIK